MKKTISVLMSLAEETLAALPGRRLNVNGEDFLYLTLARETVGRINPDTKASLLRDMKRYGWIERFFGEECTKDEGYPFLNLEDPDDETDEAYLETLLEGLLAEALYLTLRKRDLKWPRPINVARPGDRPLYAIPGDYVTLTDEMLEVRKERILKEMHRYLVKIWKAPSLRWAYKKPVYTEDGRLLSAFAPCFGVSIALKEEAFDWEADCCG